MLICAGIGRFSKSMVEKPGLMPRFMMIYCKASVIKIMVGIHLLTIGSCGIALAEISEIGSAPMPPA